MANRIKPVIAITMGDYNGIAPEVILKSVIQRNVQQHVIPLLIGSIDVFEYYARRFRISVNLCEVDGRSRPSTTGKTIPVLQPVRFHKPKITPGVVSAEAGNMSGKAIELAVELCRKGIADGIVTGPVSKDAMHRGGYKYPGQTEMLLKLSKSKRVAMMLAAKNFRVGLATVHYPLKDVSKHLTKKRILEKLSIIRDSLINDFGIPSPKIAMLGLNPHAGENGILGNEEIDVIIPAMKEAKRKKMKVAGPFPADAFFGTHAFKNYDAIMAMYHDQGLIPLKMHGFDFGVNISAGLSIVRTSPDHGTSFDIAGKGIANPSSMVEAIMLAAAMIHNRRKRKR
jgi:4-hydroxythreonine-4-phosphate dehydrogenase